MKSSFRPGEKGGLQRAPIRYSHDAQPLRRAHTAGWNGEALSVVHRRYYQSTRGNLSKATVALDGCIPDLGHPVMRHTAAVSASTTTFAQSIDQGKDAAGRQRNSWFSLASLCPGDIAFFHGCLGDGSCQLSVSEPAEKVSQQLTPVLGRTLSRLIVCSGIGPML